MKNIIPLIREILPAVTSLRREIHAHPEPGYQEVETSRKVLEKLETIAGIDIRKNLAETGIVATLGARKKGPCVALRADMDCLSIQEESTKEYASQRPGYMHACGHDGHTACLVGSALVLGEIQEDLEGPVKFIFQPAEEGGAGGLRMCREGALQDPKVDAIYALHVDPGPDLQLGDMAVCSGPVMAACGNFSVEIKGKGGHAANPQNCVDPIYIGMQMGVGFQSIVTRLTNPIESVVLTISKFHGGEVVNAIPGSALMEGSVRALRTDVFDNTMRHIEYQAENIAKAYGAKVNVTTRSMYPALTNHERSTALFHEIAELIGKRESLKKNHAPKLGGEDFAYYALEVPGTFWSLGTRPPEKKGYPFLHNSAFDFNDDALETGIEMHCEIARHFAPLWTGKR